MNIHRELDPPACALIKAFLARDSLAVRQIIRHVGEAGLDDASFGAAVADMAAMMLADACGSPAQAAALANSYLHAAVRKQVKQAA